MIVTVIVIASAMKITNIVCIVVCARVCVCVVMIRCISMLTVVVYVCSNAPAKADMSLVIFASAFISLTASLVPSNPSCVDRPAKVPISVVSPATVAKLFVGDI